MSNPKKKIEKKTKTQNLSQQPTYFIPIPPQKLSSNNLPTKQQTNQKQNNVIPVSSF